VSRPLARLGEVARVRTRRCAACGAVFIPTGKGSARRLTCDICRTGPQCRVCHGRGGLHAPSCRAGICHGCGARTAGGTKFFCEACRANRCPECRRFAGTHADACLYERRRRRPGLTEYRGLVSVGDIVALYVEVRSKAVATARRICGDLAAEDVVHDAAVYLLVQREYLRFVPGEAYFMKAVRHGALRQLRSAWHRYTVAMDPVDLVLAEQAMYANGNGHPNAHAPVRLPEPVV